MRISNDTQFRQYFYLYVLDFPELNNDLLEDLLKHYLMVHGIFAMARLKTENGNEILSQPVQIRDFDQLMLYFNKYGQI